MSEASVCTPDVDMRVHHDIEKFQDKRKFESDEMI